MSLSTVSRLPKDVAHIFRVYEHLSNKHRPVPDRVMNHFLHKSSPHYQMLNRKKLLNLSNADTPNYNAFDFPPLIRDLVSNLFDGSLKLDEDVTKLVDAGEHEHEQPIVSEKSNTSRHFADHQNQILHKLACAYSPYDSLPPVPSSQKSFMWYRKLLNETPVVIFLRQKQRLMAEPSIRGLNLPFESLNNGVKKVSGRYRNAKSINKRVRNYHLTDLTSTDIFEMALREEVNSEPAKSDSSSSSANNSGGDSAFNDKLASSLRKWRQVQITDGNGAATDLPNLSKSYSLNNIAAQLESNPGVSIKDVFPYDVHYEDLYILTIERSVFKDNHQKLLDLIESQSSIEPVAIRMLRSNALEFDTSQETENVSGGTYEELLEWARTHGKKKDPGNFSSLMRRFGEWGFVNVEESASGKALYLFKQGE